MTDFTHLPDQAISLHRHWAWAVLRAGKRIENRSQRWNYRGPICIHAAIGDMKSYREFIDQIQLVRASGALPNGLLVPKFDNMARGGIVGVATIVDCVRESDSPWFTPGFGLILEDVKPVPFIPVGGLLGPFYWKKNLENAA